MEHVKKLGSYKRFRIAFDGSPDKSELKTIHIHLFKTHQVLLKPLDPDNPAAKWVKVEEAEDEFFHDADRDFFLSVKHKLY